MRYYIITGMKWQIEMLVICCDENFHFVRHYLGLLWNKEPNAPKRIISIMEFRALVGRSIKSPADNYARAYAKRGINMLKRDRGIRLNVIEITYTMVSEKWKELKNVSE